MTSRHIFIIALATLSTLGVSCNKVLVEDPQSIISPDAFFKTEAQCVQATNGVYGHLPDIFAQSAFWSMCMAGTDLFLYHGGSTATTAIQDYDFSSASETNSYALWKSVYPAIKDANFVISRLESSPIADSAKNRLLGECKFLRAMDYYMLTNTFGDVPLWTGELDAAKVAALPRSPVADVRTQMITDLKDAAAGLPVSYDAQDVGRVTKGAALTLLAKTYLFAKDWQNAYQTAGEVISEHQYQLLSNFSDLFDPTLKNKNNKESIFEIQYNRDASTNLNYQTNQYYSWFFPQGDASGGTYAGVDFGTTLLQSYPEFYPTHRLVNLYQDADTRKEVTLAWGYNGQPFTAFPEAGYPWFGPKFWDLTANRTNSAKNLYFLRYADVLMTYAEAANELGKTADAIGALNQIEERAGLGDLDASMSQTALRQFIMDERAREFVGEFQRKWDLARWGKLVDDIQLIAGENPNGAKNVKAFNALFPIPYDEISKNPKLTQNQGY